MVTKTYEWYKAQGICPKCRRNKGENGKTLCRECLNKANERQKIKIRNGDTKRRYWERRKKNVCVVCGRPLCIGSKTRCGYHQAQEDGYNGRTRDPSQYVSVDGTPLSGELSNYYKRSKLRCDGDCFNCKYEDCIKTD